MSPKPIPKKVTTIIGRALGDLRYRGLLLRNPDRALKGYRLTTRESNTIRNVNRATFEAVEAELDKLISRFGINKGKEIASAATLGVGHAHDQITRELARRLYKGPRRP